MTKKTLDERIADRLDSLTKVAEEEGVSLPDTDIEGDEFDALSDIDKSIWAEHALTRSGITSLSRSKMHVLFTTLLYDFDMPGDLALSAMHQANYDAVKMIERKRKSALLEALASIKGDDDESEGPRLI